MDAGYVIRRATMADVEAIVALDRATIYLPHWVVAEYVAIVQPAEGDVRRRLFVADKGGVLAGFAVGKVAAIAGEVLAELESVAVEMSMRRAGLGRGLCEAVVEWARGEGAGETELEVRSRSDGPIRLYEGLGFVAIGKRPGYYKDPVDDAVLMRLEMKPH